MIESNAGPETSYTDGSVSASSTYIYRVKAVSPTGVSQWSGFVKADTPAAPVTTPEPTSTPTPTPDPTPAPADLRPTGLTVSLVENKVTLSWTAPQEDAESVDGYEILRRRPMEGESSLTTLVADTESTATTYTDATANEAGVRYVYRVKSLRGDDVSLSSNFDRIDLPADYVPDPTPTAEPEATSDDQAPTGLTAALVQGGGVALSWAAPAEDADSLTGYEVLRAAGEGEMATLAADTASTTTSYTDATATEEGETYAYQVKAIRSEERSQASGRAQVQIPHDPVDLAPSNLTALILIAIVVGEEDSTQVGLSWTPPAEDADTITGYEILRAVGQGEFTTLVDDTGSTANSYADATATQSGTSYTYKVKAIRGEDRSQASGQAQVQLPLDAVDLAPSNLTAEAVDGGVNLSWTAPAEDADSVTGYEILRAVGEGEMATLAADTASTATTYTDATATATEAGETYAYQVKAIRSQARSQSSNRVALIPVEPPATPENLAPSNLTFDIQMDVVELTWDAPPANSDSVTGYKVPRRRPNQGENELLVLKWDTRSTETTYKDGHARTPGETYIYRVRALRGDEQSRWTNFVEVRRPEAAPETTEWAPSNLEGQMHVEIALGEEESTTQVKLTWDAPAEGTEWVRGYEVQRAACDGEYTALVSDTGSTATAYTDSDVEAGESYTYRVRARRPQGLSLWSNSLTLLIPGGTGESDCGAAAQVEDTLDDGQEPTGLTPATLESTLLGYSEEEGAGTLEPNEVTFDEGATFRVTSVSTWPGVPGLVLMLTAGSSAQDAALADRDFILEADETVLVVGTTEFSFDDATLSHSVTTGDNAEYTGLVLATWVEGKPGLAAGETVAFRLERCDRPEEAQFTQHDTEFNTLQAAGNTNPTGIWSDGTTMWVAQEPTPFIGDTSTPKLFAYNMSTKARDSAKDFNTLDAAGNDKPRGLWSDGSTMWVVDRKDEKVYAYDMATKARKSSENFNNLYWFDADGDQPKARPWGIWSDGDIMWVLDTDNDDLSAYAYDMDTKARVPNEDFASLFSVGNRFPAGLWADETTMFVANEIIPNRIFAYWRSNKAPNAPRYISLEAENDQVSGIWSDGSTMWVADGDDAKIYAYALPDVVLPLDYLSLERVTDTMALVKVDIRALVRNFGSQEPAVSVKVLGSLSSATMYVHPDGGYARFLLLGLRPETQYTVIASYGVTTRYHLGDAGREVFRTDYARLAGIETSGQTHTEATVTVSLMGAGVDRGCCFRWYPHSNEGEAETEYTYYLRHKLSDETVWSDPVALTFSDFTADVKLTGLDPGAAYDVEVAETETFMPPQGSAGSYNGTMTVATDNDFGIGFDQAGFGGVIDPYGSLSPATFKLGGVDHSIVELLVRIPSFLIPQSDFGKLFLTFDRALPDDAAFTLTLGTTAFNSSDATVSGQTYSWPGGPSWSVSDSIALELDFTGAVPFREGTTLEGAFTTPTMPPTLAFEAEMTVGTRFVSGETILGYNSSLSRGSLSDTTFEVGGVEYTVKQVDHLVVPQFETLDL